MKLAVLGATGPSGLQLVQQALEGGHEVHALVRNPDGLKIIHDNLKVYKADIMSADSMKEALCGCDALFSCLGSHTYYSTNTMYSESIRSIIEAMKTAQVKRLIVITSWCTVYKPENPRSVEWLLKPLLIGRIVADMATMEDYIASQKEAINYTIVRPPGLNDKALSSEKVYTSEGGQFVKDTTYFSMPRANVANFMLSCLTTDKWDRKAVAIGMK